MYILAFTVFGILVQFCIYALLEIWYIGLLLHNFPRYGFGLSWQAWFWIHGVYAVVFLLAGALLGYFQGRYWWRRIYEEHAIRRRFLGF